MKAERLIFTLITVFFVIVAPVYWFVSHEIIGTVALILTLAFFGMISTFFSIQSRKIDPRPEDRKDAEIVEGAGDVGFFPSRSIWPFWTALTVLVMALGPVFGWWLTLLGVGLGIWSATGWCYQYYRNEYQH
ncbi:cytochrome c oxidase subunit 4 [Propionicimonas sp.]|uniref:cytochrome c oxidase subunit 4 n=1 Tax=Propionicimonas sp. TaxID=1955623 RepID=UPI0039E6D792